MCIILIGKFSFSQTEFSKCFDSLTSKPASNESFIDWENCIKGKKMPYLSLETIAGEKIKTKKLKGKILMINLWFIDCNPCIAELPALNRLAKEYKNKEVVFIGLSLDKKESLQKNFFQSMSLISRLCHMPRILSIRKLGIQVFPQLIS